jgi:glycosyltransferase involved in cell wall biosynthesis
MRIGIDACCWSNRRGFGRFTRELVSHMVRGHPEHQLTLVMDAATAREGTFPSGAQVVPVETDVQATVAAAADGSRSGRDLLRMAVASARCDFDAFFFPAVYSYYPLFRRVPTVVTFHDAIAEQNPHLIFSGRKSRLFWNLKTWLARRQADRVLTVSNAAKQQIVAAFAYPESQIRVITEGPGEGFAPVEDRQRLRRVLEKYALPQDRPVLLYVGGISPHKNLGGLLTALARLREQSAPPWHMAIVGDYQSDAFLGCYQDLERQRRALTLEDRVTFTGYVPNEDLVALYSAAAALVLPSFNEGFGLPVVEAMACGLPVAASHAGSLPEVLADAGVYFDPADPGQIAAALQKLLSDERLRTQLKTRGLQRAERFNWSSAARQTIGLFEELMRAPGTIA